MERFTWYKFFALSFLLLSHIFAAPIGNPGAPKILQKGFFIPENVWVNIRVGYEGDFIFYGPMKQSGSSFDLDKYTQFVSSGSFTLNVLERLDLYTSLGASTWDYQFRFLSPKDLAKLSCVQTPYDFIWAVGARALLYSLDRLDFGIGGRYGRSDPSINYFTVNGQDLSSSEDHITFEMWQANAFGWDLSWQFLFESRFHQCYPLLSRSPAWPSSSGACCRCPGCCGATAGSCHRATAIPGIVSNAHLAIGQVSEHSRQEPVWTAP